MSHTRIVFKAPAADGRMSVTMAARMSEVERRLAQAGSRSEKFIAGAASTDPLNSARVSVPVSNIAYMESA